MCGTPSVTSDPILGPLANNGGPTQTFALLSGSPAINAGNNASAVDAGNNSLTTDQRGTGFPRIMNGTVDIGAFEVTHSILLVIPGSATSGRERGLGLIDLDTSSSSGRHQAGTFSFGYERVQRA